MANRARTVLKFKKGLYHALELGSVTVTGGSVDTFTLDNFHATKSPLRVYVFTKENGTPVTVTYGAGTYVVTVTDGAIAANTPCYYVAYGVNP